MQDDENFSDQMFVFLDANIVLEGRPLDELPWQELTSAGTIHALIVPTAMEEIDAKKRDGRLGPHARSFNRLIASSVIDGQPVIVREENPRVELEMATCSPIPWKDYDELAPDDGDSRIVAEALNARNLDFQRSLLVSHDIKPLAYAKGRNLAVYKASDAWLRPIEPSPKDKKIQRLKQQVSEFKKNEPTFDISIEVSESIPATIYKVLPLDSDQADSIKQTICVQNPRASQERDRFAIGLSEYDSEYDGKYDHYIAETVPRFVSKFHEKMEMLFNQRFLQIKVTNAGQIRADHLVVSVSTSDGWLNERIVCVSLSGPPAPHPQPYWQRLSQMSSLRDIMPARVGRHDFETIRRPVRSTDMEDACEDFRTGQEYYFQGVIMPSTAPAPTEITVALTAANLRGERIETFAIEKKIVEVPASTLVDLEEFQITKEFPTQEELQRLLQQEQYDDIEWDGRDEDD